MLINLVTNVLWYIEMNYYFNRRNSNEDIVFLGIEKFDARPAFMFVRQRIYEEMGVNAVIFLALATSMRDWVQAQWM